MKSRHTAAFQIWKITYFIIAQRCPFFNRQLCSLCKENWLNIFGAERSPYFLSASTYFTICRSSTRSKPFTTPFPFRSATERVAGSEILYASPNMYWFNATHGFIYFPIIVQISRYSFSNAKNSSTASIRRRQFSFQIISSKRYLIVPFRYAFQTTPVLLLFLFPR